MRFRGLDLNLLIALNALLVEKSVSSAARRLFLSQSAMSGALARLRVHFEDELLIPLGRRLVLTAFAESIADPIQQLMDHIEATVGTGTCFEPATAQRNFTLAVADYMTELVMPHVAARVAREAPGVMLEIVSPAGVAAEMLENGQVDMLIVAEHIVSSLFHAELLSEEAYVVIGWTGNPRLAPPLTAETFFDLGRVAGRFGRNRLPSYAEIQMQKYPGAQKIELIAPSFTSIPKFLVGTERIALMHRRLAEVYARSLPLVVLPVPVELLPLRVMLQHHSVRSSDVGIQWLKAIIRDSIEETYESI